MSQLVAPFLDVCGKTALLILLRFGSFVDFSKPFTRGSQWPWKWPRGKQSTSFMLTSLFWAITIKVLSKYKPSISFQDNWSAICIFCLPLFVADPNVFRELFIGSWNLFYWWNCLKCFCLEYCVSSFCFECPFFRSLAISIGAAVLAKH